MKNIKKIIKAFSQELPVDAEWYQARLKECESCEYNSDNVDIEELPLVDKLATKAKLSLKSCERVCLACGCCIDQKASLKEVACGLEEIGLEPKWKPLITQTYMDSGITFETIGDYEMSISKSVLTISLTTDKNVVDVDLNLKHKQKGFEVINVKASCGCTVPKTVKREDGSYDLTLSVSTVKFKEGVETSKFAEVKYQVGNNVLYFTVKLKITKK